MWYCKHVDFCFVKTVIDFSISVLVNIWQATGVRLGMAIQSVASLLTGIIIAFIYSWEFALFILGLAPFFLIAGFLEMKLMAGFSGNEALEGAGQVSILCINLICMNYASSVCTIVLVFCVTCIILIAYWMLSKVQN